LAKLDGRTKEARLMRDTRNALAQHLGGKPSVTQTMVIDRVCNLTLRIATMDRKFAETGTMTELDTRQYLAWSAALTRLLRQLGFAGAAPKPRTLAEVRGQAA
jgi:hypothetical protein